MEREARVEGSVKPRATFTTSKRAERDLSTSVKKEKKALFETAMATEITEKSRVFGKLNSNKRGAVQMDAPVPRSPKCKVQICQMRDHILKNLGPNLVHKEKSNSPRRQEERGSSFHEVLSVGSSSKGTGSSGSSGPSNNSLILENDDSASSSDAGASSDFSNGHCARHHGSSSEIADEDEEGDGIISLGKMKWFFELNETQQTSDTNVSTKAIPIIIEDISSDDDREIHEIIAGGS